MTTKFKSNSPECVVALMNDHTVQVIPDSNVDYRNIEYLLVPLQGQKTESFIYLKPTKTSQFTKARFEYQLSIYYCDDGMPQYAFPLSEENIETNSVITFYNLLHSFLRYQQLTCLEVTYYDDIMPGDIYVDINYFNIYLYDRDDNIYYSAQIPPNMSTCEKGALLDKIMHKVYRYDINLFGRVGSHKFIRIRKNKWDICESNRLKREDLVGVGSCFTITIGFISYNTYLNLLSSIRGMSIEFSIIDDIDTVLLNGASQYELNEIISDKILPVMRYMYWINNIGDMIAFVDMMNIYSKLLNVYCNIFFNMISGYYDIDNSKYRKSFSVYKTICIDPLIPFSIQNHIVLNDNESMSINDLIDYGLLLEKYNDEVSV